MRLMREAAMAQSRVLAEPAPKAFLGAFQDSGLELELWFWIGDPENGTLGVRSEVNLAIWRAFADAGLRIPFPQREVRLLGVTA
jgi:small-conductance mechanosensitive channel